MPDVAGLLYSQQYKTLGVSEKVFNFIAQSQSIKELIDGGIDLDEAVLNVDFNAKPKGSTLRSEQIELSRLKYFQLAALKKIIEKEFKKFSLKNHPDKGGDQENFQRINSVREELFKLLDNQMAYPSLLVFQQNRARNQSESQIQEFTFGKDGFGEKVAEVLKKNQEQHLRRFEEAKKEQEELQQKEAQEEIKRQESLKIIAAKEQLNRERSEFQGEISQNKSFIHGVLDSFIQQIEENAKRNKLLTDNLETVTNSFQSSKSAFSRLTNFFGINSQNTYNKAVTIIRNTALQSAQSSLATRDDLFHYFGLSSQDSSKPVGEKLKEYIKNRSEKSAKYQVSDTSFFSLEKALIRVISNGLKLRKKLNDFKKLVDETTLQFAQDQLQEVLPQEWKPELGYHVDFIAEESGEKISILMPEAIFRFSYSENGVVKKEFFYGEANIWDASINEVTKIESYNSSRETLNKSLDELLVLIKSKKLKIVSFRVEEKELIEENEAQKKSQKAKELKVKKSAEDKVKKEETEKQKIEKAKKEQLLKQQQKAEQDKEEQEKKASEEKDKSRPEIKNPQQPFQQDQKDKSSNPSSVVGAQNTSQELPKVEKTKKILKFIDAKEEVPVSQIVADKKDEKNLLKKLGYKEVALTSESFNVDEITYYPKPKLSQTVEVQKTEDRLQEKIAVKTYQISEGEIAGQKLRIFSPEVSEKIASQGFSSDKFAFSRAVEELKNSSSNDHSPNQIKTSLESLVQKAATHKDVQIDQKTAAKIILIAIKHQGIGQLDKETIKESLRIVGLENSQEMLKKAANFSREFQEAARQESFLTGNIEAKSLVGMRLKRLTPDVAFEIFRGKNHLNLSASEEMPDQNQTAQEFEKLLHDLGLVRNLPSPSPQEAKVGNSQSVNQL